MFVCAFSDIFIKYIFSVPLPVSNLDEILSNDTSIHLEWTLPNNTDFHYRHFIVRVTGVNGAVTYEITGDQSELPLTNLNPGSMYNVSVIVSTGYETSAPVIGVFYTRM